MPTPTSAHAGTVTIAAHPWRGVGTGLTPVPPPPHHNLTVLHTGAPLWAYAVIALAAAVITLTLQLKHRPAARAARLRLTPPDRPTRPPPRT